MEQITLKEDTVQLWEILGLDSVRANTLIKLYTSRFGGKKGASPSTVFRVLLAECQTVQEQIYVGAMLGNLYEKMGLRMTPNEAGPQNIA